MKKLLFLKHSSILPNLRHIEDYLEHSLARFPEQLQLLTFDLVKEVRNVEAGGADRSEIYKRYRDYTVKWLREQAPDAVLFMNGYSVETIFPGFWAELRAAKLRLIAWHADDPYYIDIQEPIAPNFDTILTVDTSAMGLWKHMVRSVHYLPLAFAPESTEDSWAGVSPQQYGSDVCFVGTPFAGSRRVRIIDESASFLAKLNTRLVGAGRVDSWHENLRNYGLLAARIVDRPVSPREAVRYFVSSTINLNIHKDSFGHAWDRNSRRIVARSPNERFFAVAGTGSFQLVDNSRPDLFSMFPADALETFDIGSSESFRERVSWCIDNPEGRYDKARRLQELVIANHTYDQRAAFIAGLL